MKRTHIQPFEVAGLAWIAGLTGLTLATLLACDWTPPPYTPSAPQQTAGAYNATYAAGTMTALAGPSLTPTPPDTPTDPAPSRTPTSSICELPTLGPGTFILEVTPCP